MNAARRHLKPGLGTAAVVVVLAAGSTVAMAAASGAFTSTRAAGHASAYPSVGRVPACTAPALAGAVVDVTLTDMGAGAGMGTGPYGFGGNGDRAGMMGRGGTTDWWPAGMMTVRVRPASVPAGTVSLRVANAGALAHELVVLPLTDTAQPGYRGVGSDGTVSETGSLGEASRNCGSDAGDGINPGGLGWTTLHLDAGRYEVVCNLPGHYAARMYAELDVTD